MFDRKQHWQNLYRDRSPGEVSWHQQEPHQSIELIRACQLDLSAPIIDVGGGASRLVDALAESGFSDISVLDISSFALQHAQQRLGSQAETIDWIEADITEFIPSRYYAVWHDRAVFHFLTERADREKYVAALHQCLSSGGYLILASFAIGGPRQCSGLDIIQYDAEKIQAELGPGFTLLEQHSEDHLTPTNRIQAFQYFRLKKTA
jgi:SAM-dependent methyltransferase